MFLPPSFSPSALVGLLVLALGPQPALSVFDFVTFSSALQCAPFTVQFSGGSAPTSWPPQLTIVPFNSTPISIRLFDAAFNDTTATGHATTFLPLSQGTQFLASLDDGNGASAGPVSEVLTTGASNFTRCLKSNDDVTTNAFSVTSNVSQCQPFTVNYGTADAPSIRAFIPGKLAFTINQTKDDDATNTASYLMDAARGTDLALVISNGSVEATSGLLTVGGNARSSVNVGIRRLLGIEELYSIAVEVSLVTIPMLAAHNPSVLFFHLCRGAIIAIAASSGAVIGTIVVAMGIWIFCSRRKVKAAARAASLEAGTSSVPPDANMTEKPPSLAPAGSMPTNASWDFQMQTSWGSSRSKSTDNVQRNPLYTDPNLWLSSPTASSALAGLSKASSPVSARLPSSSFSLAGVLPTARLASASAFRRTPPASASAGSIRSQTASRTQRHSRSHTQSSAWGSRHASSSSPRSPASLAPTISTIDIEHILDMSARYAPSSSDARDPTPPLPLRQSLYAPRRDSIRNSAYYAAQFPDLNGFGAARKAHSREGSATNTSNPSLVRGRVTPPNLQLGQDRRRPSSSASSLYSLHEGERESAGANRLLMTSPTVHVSPTGEVIREPPQANVPQSPMPSPFPSPL
ncbi:uncharacterized protein B0H18DRAFT_957056 [Fomitopsis serialis]|uniref:uncharacterized protein n=1 Tax=Fomitopsis serialis TaxID=139415 RepID=UPI0020075FF4|nr:uncharacterized protein B0H18DRAFT_957056 [Neoantrodia serialis]KAH9920469.1 hypothetical protein B0H18DRAFT_957056 [Neoantrodia serialis]